MIKVQNSDDECLKWAPKAARFPPADGRNLQRTSKYPKDDGLNWEGIRFPTPLADISRLEKQNPTLATSVYGWGEDYVLVYRISEQPKTVRRINLLLLEKEETPITATSKKCQRCCTIRPITSTNLFTVRCA